MLVKYLANIFQGRIEYELIYSRVVMYYTPAHFGELECVHYYCVVMYTHPVLLAH